MDSRGSGVGAPAGKHRPPGADPGGPLTLASRPAILDTPDSALNGAFTWAVGRAGGVVRADPSFDEDDWGGADFDRLVQDARQWRRVGAAALDPQGFLLEVVGGLWGVRADAAGGRFEVAPWIPEGWRSLALRRLRCHRTLLDVEARPRAEWITLRLSVTFGPPIALGLSVRNAGLVTGVTVDEVPLEGRRAIFTAAGEHEAVFFLIPDP